MQTITEIVARMRRPRLLIRAARIGAGDYDRDRHLARLLGSRETPRLELALARLVEAEAPLDAARRAGSTGYSPARHVELLSAIIAEAEIARRAGTTAHRVPAADEAAPVRPALRAAGTATPRGGGAMAAARSQAKASGTAAFLRAT